MATCIFSSNSERGSALKSPGAIAHSGFAAQLTGFIQDWAIAPPKVKTRLEERAFKVRRTHVKIRVYASVELALCLVN